MYVFSEIQHVTENHLMQLRNQEENRHQSELIILDPSCSTAEYYIYLSILPVEVQEWVSKIQDPEELQHILSLMKLKHSKTLRETDMKLVLHLDQKVKDQQATLEKAGVPGFYVTDNAKEMKIQMHLLDFILRLSITKYVENK